ncbi:MAG: hypothetical protein JNM85_08770 [Chthonomonas sp.]|nr:hypothetical protein [Chthonomonas sp.]
MFRLLYWIVEEVRPDGSSSATGIYTSIHDLKEKGLRRIDGDANALRLSLVKVDSMKAPLGVWMADDARQLEADMQAYIETGEFTSSMVEDLLEAFSATTR